MANEVCSWILPPILGQVVMVDPGGRDAQNYGDQSGHGMGYVSSVNTDIRMAWHRISEDTKNAQEMRVIWDNGRENVYRIRDLLPFANKYKDLAKYSFNRGDSIFGEVEKLQDKLDRKLIYEGRFLSGHTLYDEKYRHDLFRRFANKYKEIIESGDAVNEYQMATIEELIRMGYLNGQAVAENPITGRDIAEILADPDGILEDFPDTEIEDALPEDEDEEDYDPDDIF